MNVISLYTIKKHLNVGHFQNVYLCYLEAHVLLNCYTVYQIFANKQTRLKSVTVPIFHVLWGLIIFMGSQLYNFIMCVIPSRIIVTI